MSNETKISPRDRVSAVLDCFDFPEGERPEIVVDDWRAWAEFPLNDRGDLVEICAWGEGSFEIFVRSDLGRAKKVAAFLNTLDGEG